MARAHGDELVSHPGHPVDVADALVAGMQGGGSRSRVDTPYVKEAILRGPYAGQIARVWTEGYAIDAEGVFC